MAFDENVYTGNTDVPTKRNTREVRCRHCRHHQYTDPKAEVWACLKEINGSHDSAIIEAADGSTAS